MRIKLAEWVRRLLLAGGAALMAQMTAAGAISALPLIDAHSQAGRTTDLAGILDLMERAGVAHTILSNYGGLAPGDLVRFATAHPHRITASLGLKGREYPRNSERFHAELERARGMRGLGALSEIMIWHEAKGTGRRAGRSSAPEIDLDLHAPQAVAARELATARGWPVVLHIEFGSAGARMERLMTGLERLLATDRSHPVALMHMGQLGAARAAALVAAHPNIHFLTSHANPLFAALSNRPYPWTPLIAGRRLAAEWRDLALAHPDRFILAFDSVLPEHWAPDFYLAQAALWRDVLGDLPEPVARAIAHRNARRLWRLPPVE